MVWSDNAIMFWNDAGQWKKVSDHNRQPLSASVERIENKQRMADGTMRRYSVSKKRTWSTSWDHLPSTNTKAKGLTTADGGMSGEEMETFHNNTNGSFSMQLRRGDGTIETVTVMISDFSKEVVRRGPLVDFWNLDITLEEV